ncbi:putative tapemeasure chaperone protein [Lactobacillus phage LfeInf]|uniref:Putative tapemeasure chaperone protein n=1 Tax=Lactobacillus phage LfeInf TaxID=1567484 RepID=A0A0A7NNR0_9CAUD|nr:tail assembly chaperone [Lactobacillus phage LfeInf]AIZ94695.1 putative tapemeasure chaperone protein [Lactobacillus phage LfeInf]
MATSQQREQILKEMREKERQQAEIAKRTGRAPVGGMAPKEEEKKVKKDDTPVDTDLRVKQLEEQLKKAKEENADLTDQLDAKNSSKRYSKEQEALADITSSNDAYHFVKEYTYDVSYPTNGTKQKKIVVKMHAPSVAEQAKIQGNYVELTNGLGDGFLANAKDLFLAIAYFQVVGDNVPVWFTNLDNTYRTDVLFQVWGGTTKNGYTPFWTPKHNKDDEVENYNPLVSPAINKVGGIEPLVKSVSGRNLWAIMKFFRVLPNDPKLRSLTYAQREFIIQSMNEDVREQELAAKGMEETASYSDDSFEKKFYSNKEEDLLEGDEDLDKLYQQSLQLKQKTDINAGMQAKDLSQYDKEITEKINTALYEHQKKQESAHQQIQQNWDDILKDSKQYQDND